VSAADASRAYGGTKYLSLAKHQDCWACGAPQAPWIGQTLVGQAEKVNHCCSDRITAESPDLSISHVQGTCSVVGTQVVEVMYVAVPYVNYRDQREAVIHHLGPTTVVGNLIPECELATDARSNAGYITTGSRPSAS
jgi:hypothetical protein